MNMFEFDIRHFVIGFLVFIGSYCSLLWLYDNLKSVIQIIISMLSNDNLSLAKRYGDWAVVTGATDGIGKEYALNLAKQNINIVLISRTKEKLIDVANEIESKYSVKTKWIVADFSQGYEIYQHIKDELKDIPVGILVNNVGRMYDYPDELGNISEKLLWDILNINIGSVLMMTRIFINDMKKNRKGAIINISSGSELQPSPFKAVYGASKVFVKHFTLALQYEYAAHDITIQLISPMYVRTKMNQFSKTLMKEGTFFIPDVKSYARSAVFTLGKTDRTSGYWTHEIQVAFMKLAPEWFRTIISADMYKKFQKEYFEKQRIEKLVK